MNSKKWCVVAFFGALAAVLSVAVFNIIVDPFGVFGDDWYSYNITNNPRVGKIEYLKENHEKYDSYIIGCSSTSSYPVESLNKYLDARFYNLIMYGGDMLDVEQTVYYIGENYEVKNLVVNIYISNGIDYDVEPDRLTNSMHPEADRSSKLKFYSKYAFVSPEYSFAKLSAKRKDRYLSEPFDVFDEETGAYDKRKRDAEQVSDLDAFYENYPVFLNYPVMEYHLEKFKECADSVERIKNYCEEKGINFIPVNGPVYYEYFKCFPKDEVKRYYEALAEKTDFWDFSVSSVSLEPRFFYDDTHFRNEVGDMAIARVFDDDGIYIPEDFGFYVTKDNVSEYVESLYGKTFSDSGYTKKLPVLLYHHIDEEVKNDMTVSLNRFEEHMKVISDNGYSTVTVDQVIDYIEKGKDLPEKAVMITFDDGYMSNYTYAYPVLGKFNLNAVVFAVGETFGSDTYPGTDVKIYPHFGMDEKKELDRSGVIDTESHSFGLHQNASYEEGEAYPDMLKKESETDEEYVLRIKEDWKKWEEVMGETPKALAFPHGGGDLLLQAVLNECGIKLTFSTNQKADTLVKGIKLSGYSLGRFTVTENTTPEDVLNLIKQ